MSEEERFLDDAGVPGELEEKVAVASVAVNLELAKDPILPRSVWK
jgi:hypothetical protein